MSANGAQATGAELHLETFGMDYSEMRTNGPLVDAYSANLERLGRTMGDLADVPASVAGSTDMGNVSKVVPAIHPMIAIAPARVPLHSPEFAEWAGSGNAQRGVIDAAKALAMTALDVLCDAELRAAIQAAFGTDMAAAEAADD